MAKTQFSTRSKMFFLARHLVETQICTLSKIFWVKKSTLKVGTSPYDRKPKYPPGNKALGDFLEHENR